MISRNAEATAKLQALLDTPRASLKSKEAMELVRAGADPDLKGKWDNLALIHDLANGDKSNDATLKELVETYQATIDITDKEGLTALQRLINSHRFSGTAAQHLVNLGANPNLKSKACPPLIHQLVEKGEFAAINELVTGKPPVKDESKDEAQPSAEPEEFKPLHPVDLDILDKDGHTALQRLIESFRFTAERALNLVKLGANPNVKAKKCLPLIHQLVEKGEFTAIAELSTKSKFPIEMDIQDSDGHTPLQRLIDSFRFNGERALNLVNLGANPNAKAKKCLPLLHQLIEKGEFETIEVLVKHPKNPAQIDIQDADGHSPLQRLMSSFRFNIERAMKLVRLGANPRVEGPYSVPFLSQIVLANVDRLHDDEIKYLVQTLKLDLNPAANAKKKTPAIFSLIEMPSYLGKIAYLNWLRELGAELNLKGEYERSALHHAAQSADLAVGSWLVEQGLVEALTVDSLDYFGETPLQTLCASGQKQSVSLQVSKTIPTLDKLPPEAKNAYVVVIGNSSLETFTAMADNDKIKDNPMLGLLIALSATQEKKGSPKTINGLYFINVNGTASITELSFLPPQNLSTFTAAFSPDNNFSEIQNLSQEKLGLIKEYTGHDYSSLALQPISEFMTLLENQGANLGHQNVLQQTLLHSAAANRDTEVALALSKRLVESAKVEINAFNHSDQNALALANTEAVKAYLATQIKTVTRAAPAKPPTKPPSNSLKSAELNYFMSLLDLMATKASDLYDRGHYSAANTATTLETNLRFELDSLLKNPSNKDSQNKFRQACQAQIELARPELDQHRDSGYILANIALAIAGAGVLYLISGLINMAVTGSFMFFGKTDASSKVDLLEDNYQSILAY